MPSDIEIEIRKQYSLREHSVQESRVQDWDKQLSKTIQIIVILSNVMTGGVILAEIFFEVYVIEIYYHSIISSLHLDILCHCILLSLIDSILFHQRYSL